MTQRMRDSLEPTRQVRPEKNVEAKAFFPLRRTPEDVPIGTASEINGDADLDRQNFAEMNHGAAAPYDDGGGKGKTQQTGDGVSESQLLVRAVKRSGRERQEEEGAVLAGKIERPDDENDENGGDEKGADEDRPAAKIRHILCPDHAGPYDTIASSSSHSLIYAAPFVDRRRSRA
jgi:hypothetical protein